MATRSAQKRAAVLEAARAVFEAQGYQAATMDEIAARAGVSKRTVYHHFASKEALFEALVEATWAAMEGASRLRYDPSAPLEAQLRAMALGKLRVLCAPEVLRMLRSTLAEFLRDPALSGQFLARTAAQEQPLVAWLEAADRGGRMRVPDPVLAAKQFWALAKGEVFWVGLIQHAAITEAQLEAAVTQALDLFLCRYQAPRSGEERGEGAE
jgi:TetR/AcrR family transcriptional regulator of autoinduction and epiphytic fitness